MEGWHPFLTGHATISDIEKGHYIPAADTLEKLADALELSPCWLGYGLGPRRLPSAEPP